jgi:hypothetical protein
MNRMLPAVLIALCALLGVALAFQRSALNDARREQEELGQRLDRVEAKQKEAVARKTVEELQEQVKSAEKKAAAAAVAAEAAAKRPPPAAPAPAAAPANLEEDIEKIVEAKLEEKMQKKGKGGLGEDRKMPIFDLAKELSLDPAQQTKVTAIANTAKKEIFDILKTPRPDGTNVADELLTAFTSGDQAAVQKVFARVITEKIPGTDTPYITAVGRVQEKANQGLSVAMGGDAYSKYQGMNLKPENIETGFDPWLDYLQQKGK